MGIRNWSAVVVQATHMGRTDFEKAIGQPVTLEAVRAKDGSRYGYLYKITFADGVSVELR